LAPLQRLQRGRERGPVHCQEIRQRCDAGRLRPVQRHQQRELPVGEIERPEGVVEPARQGPRRALGRQAQACVAHMQRRLEGNPCHKRVMLTSTYQVKLSVARSRERAMKQGQFFWYDVMTTDTKAAAKFYGAVVGWGTEDAGPGYALFTVNGQGVA